MKQNKTTTPDNDIMVKVDKTNGFQKLERNLLRAYNLNEELIKVLKDIQKTTLVITTEFGHGSNSNSTKNKDRETSVRDIESSIADEIVDNLENNDLSYESWLRISAKIENCYQP